MVTELLNPEILLPWLLSMVFGIFVGATPGLTATMAVAMILPLTFHMEPTAGLAMIVGVSFTAIFAGDIPATFLRIPGTPASAAATLDSYQLALRNEGGLAILLDLLCSMCGGLIGVLMLIFVSRPLANFAVRFASFEYFWLGVLGLSLSAIISPGRVWKGIFTAALGVLLATIGNDVVGGTPRFTFGSEQLARGLHFIPAMIGLFGMTEVFRKLRSTAISVQAPLRIELPLWRALRELVRHWRIVLQSSFLGTFIGALPGAGADVAAWAAYGFAQRSSSKREQFGTGALEGVIAPSSANNAAVGGAWIPALVFGIPGDAVTAIMLGALMMHNIQPGQRLFTEHADRLQAVFGIALITQLLLLPAGWIGIRAFTAMLRLPQSVIMTGVVVFAVVGSYAVENNWFDVFVMFAFGLLGLALEAYRAPVAPLILGLILGDVVEENLRVGLVSSGGSFVPFFTRPDCVVMIGILFAAAWTPVVARRWRKGR